MIYKIMVDRGRVWLKKLETTLSFYQNSTSYTVDMASDIAFIYNHMPTAEALEKARPIAVYGRDLDTIQKVVAEKLEMTVTVL